MTCLFRPTVQIPKIFHLILWKPENIYFFIWEAVTSESVNYVIFFYSGQPHFTLISENRSLFSIIRKRNLRSVSIGIWKWSNVTSSVVLFGDNLQVNHINLSIFFMLRLKRVGLNPAETNDFLLLNVLAYCRQQVSTRWPTFENNALWVFLGELWIIMMIIFTWSSFLGYMASI